MLRWRSLAFLLVLSLLPRGLFSHEPPSPGAATVGNPSPSTAPSPSPTGYYSWSTASPSPSTGDADIDNPPDSDDPQDEPLDINIICGKVAFPERCLSTIHSEAPGPLDAIDPDTVLKLEIAALYAVTEAARNKAKEIAINPMTDALTKSILLQSCVGFYESALTGQLKKISDARSDDDVYTMKSLILNFTIGCSICGEAFSQANLLSPMQAEDDAIKELAANSMSLVLAFWPSSPQPFQFTPVNGGDIESDDPTLTFGMRQAYTFRDKLSVETICGRCMHAERCLTSVIRSVATGSAIGSLVDAATVMKVEMDALYASITVAMERAQSLGKDPKIHAYTRSDLLPDCIGLYKQALMEFEHCKKAFVDNNREAMTGSFSLIASVSDNSESVFADAYTVSLLKEENLLIRELSSNCLDIASEFWPRPDAATSSAESIASSPAVSMAPAASPGTDPQGVEFVCSKAKNPDRCLSSALDAATSPLDAADALTILKLEIKAVVIEIKAAKEKTKSLIDDPKTEPRFKSKLLPGCLQALERSFYDAEEVGKLLAMNDLVRASGLLTSIANYLYGCRTHAKDVVGSPIQSETDGIAQLLDNGLSIMAFFWPTVQSPSSAPIPSISAGPPTCNAPDADNSDDTLLSLDQLHARTPEAGHLISGPRGPLDPLDLRTICSLSIYFDRCLSAVKAVAKGPLGSADADTVVTNAVDVLQLTIQASVNGAKKMAKEAAAYTKIPNIDIKTLRVFDMCRVMYLDMAKRLETAREQVQEGSVGNIKFGLKVAHENCRCKLLFDEAGLVMPMRAEEEDLEQLMITNINIAQFFWPGNWI